jgi:hypothetical protein
VAGFDKLRLRDGSCSTSKPIGRIDSAREEFDFHRNAKTRVIERADSPVCLLCQGAVECKRHAKRLSALPANMLTRYHHTMRTMRRIRVFIPATGLLTICLLTGCPYEDQINALNKQLETANQTAKEYQKVAEDYKNQWDKFGKQMVDASDKMDPLYLKELFRANKSLADLNEELRKRLASSAYGGILFLDTQQLVLRVHSFKGHVVTSAKIDPDEPDVNPVFQEELRSTTPALSVSFTIGRDYLPEVAAYIRDLKGDFAQKLQRASDASNPENQMKAVDERYARQVSTAFTNFLQNNAYESPASGVTSHWEIRDKLRRSGHHQIEVSVQNLDSGQPWDITFELVAVDNQNHREENLGTSQLNPNTVARNPNGTIRIDQSTGVVHDTLPVWVKYHNEAAEQRAVSNASSNQ